MRHEITVLAVDDVGRAADFYGRLFGWRRKVDIPGVFVEFGVPNGPAVAVYAREWFARNTGRAAAAAPAGGTTSAEIYFRTDDPDAAVERAVAAGATLLSAAAERPWRERVGYVADPDGNVLAFARILEHDDGPAFS